MRIAEVVLSGGSREVDRKFCYYVPDHALAGARVVVPFGRGNRPVEGIIAGFTTEDRAGMKSASALLDETPLCTPALLRLAEHVRERYLCTWYQAYRLVIPSGVTVKTSRWITLLDLHIDIKKAAGRSKVKAELLQQLADAGGTLDYAYAAHHSNLGAVLRSLEADGIVSLDDTVALSGGSRTVRMAAIGAAEPSGELLRRAPKQARMLEILRQTGDLAVADLVAFSGASYAAANSLEKKGLIRFYDRVVYRSPIQKQYARTEALPLTAEQQAVLDGLIAAAESGDGRPNLIRGVTGSGKTEVFLQIIEYYLKRGRQAVVLVPEIALTPQMVSRFAGRFGGQVSVLHSGLSAGERYDEWQKILKGEVSVAVGARSAVFAPFSDLGIMIIDEEHETSYKSEAAPYYDARELARFRCAHEGALLVEGSATPSVGAYYRALQGEARLFEMHSRHHFQQMPRVAVADMRRELEAGNYSPFSRLLRRELEYNIKKGQQSILFLNRRGFNSFVLCRSCGEAVMCRNCSVTMTYHKRGDVLRCHYCGFEQPNVSVCPACGSPHIRFMGTGTEKIEEALCGLYGPESFLRMDADTTAGKNSHEAILERFEKQKVPVLLGTQMVTKGLDFPNVTLVGVLAADLSLNMDDFRAAERTFSQLTQVCGRAGRGELAGRAVIQTYQPEHYAVEFAKSHDYRGFYEQEIRIRRQLGNPPFCDFVLIMMQGEDEAEVQYELARIARRLKSRDLTVLGPVPAPYSRIKNKFRWRVIVKHADAVQLLPLLHKIWEYYAKGRCLLSIDINPNSMN